MQTQHEFGRRYTGLIDALRSIAAEEGRSALMRGIAPRVILHSMSAAIVWAVYEYFKDRFESKPVDLSRPRYPHLDP